MLRFERAVETKRRPGQRRIEVFSPKIKRRLTLFSWDSHDAWLLLEADPTVRTMPYWRGGLDAVDSEFMTYDPRRRSSQGQRRCRIH